MTASSRSGLMRQLGDTGRIGVARCLLGRRQKYLHTLARDSGGECPFPRPGRRGDDGGGSDVRRACGWTRPAVSGQSRRHAAESVRPTRMNRGQHDDAFHEVVAYSKPPRPASPGLTEGGNPRFGATGISLRTLRHTGKCSRHETSPALHARDAQRLMPG